MEDTDTLIKSINIIKINWNDPLEISTLQSLVVAVCQQALKSLIKDAKIREKRRRENQWKSNVRSTSLRNS